MPKSRKEVRQRRRRQRIERKKRPLQWLYDRVNGVTLEGEDEPPCFLCLPPLSLKVFPWLLERNGCCICLGGMGCCASNDKWARLTILKVGATCNVLGFLGLLVAVLALINSESMLAFATATLTDLGDGTSISTTLKEMKIHLGVRAAVFVNPNTFGTLTLPYDRFCETSLGLDSYLSVNDCAVCKDTTLSRMIAILVALVAIVPTFGIDITRGYSNFDVNCQKVASSFLSLVTLVGCVIAYLQFDQCLDSFYSGPIYYDSANGNTAFDPQSNPNAQFLNTEGFRQVNFQWQVDYGLLGLFAAMAFKSIHFICNCCIPTPTITRDRDDQEEYEQLALERNDEEGLDVW